jgi:uncharacterized protein YndB with AHSA1/START domain
MATNNKTRIVSKPGRQDIIITREFESSPDKLFKAHIDPELYSQWLAPRKFVMDIQRFEPKAGGSWSYVFRDMDGHTLSFHGFYHEVKKDEKIVSTFEFEGEGYTILSVTKFEKLSPKGTRLTIQSIFQTIEERDAEAKYLTGDHLDDSFTRLEQLLTK